MRLFDIVPEKFFSVLTSKNKDIYIDALFVMRRCYRQELLMRKEDLVAMFIHHLEDRMVHLSEEEGDDPIGEENLSGRAHFLLRKLIDTGWLEKENDLNSFKQYLVVPDYAAQVLDVLYEITDESPGEYNSLVYSTYSALHTADAERDDFMPEALLQSHSATRTLRESLIRLYNNMRRYYQKLQDQAEVREVLKQHFDNYQVLIMDKIYHPLKTFDSVPRFKTRILNILRNWLTDREVIEKIASSMVRRGYRPGIEDARSRVVAMLGEIIDTYENIDKYLREIDRKNAGYTRASVERTQYLLNTDRDTRGKLVEVLKKLPKLQDHLPLETEEMLNGDLGIHRQFFVDEASLFRERRRKMMGEALPLPLANPAGKEEVEQEFTRFAQRLREGLTHGKIIDFVNQYLSGREAFSSRELRLEEVEDFIKIILAVMKNGEEEIPYQVQFLNGYIYVNGYRIPDMIFSKTKQVV